MKKLFTTTSLFILLGFQVIIHAQEQSSGIPMAEVLNADGTIKLEAIKSGRINPDGYRFEVDKDGKPKFIPTGPLVSQTELEGAGTSQNLGAADANWEQDFEETVDYAEVYSVAIKDNRIFVGGEFNRIGNQTLQDFAVYDNSTGQWSDLGLQTNGCCSVSAIEIVGNDVYVGGFFFTETGIQHLAKWDGSSWTSPGGNSLNGGVTSIAVADGNVYVGGFFNDINGDPKKSRIAFWDGTNWNAMGDGLNDAPVALTANADGSRVYAGGCFGEISDAGVTIPYTNFVAYWDTGSSTWNSLHRGLTGCVEEIATDGQNLFVVGCFGEAINNSGVAISNTNNIVRWSEASGWNSVYASNPNLNGCLQTITEVNGTLYVGGRFDDDNSATPLDVNGVAAIDWNGDQTWKSPGSGIGSNSVDYIHDIESDGDNVIVGGRFVQFNNEYTKRFAVLNTSQQSWNYFDGDGPSVGNIEITDVEFYTDPLGEEWAVLSGRFHEGPNGLPVSNIAAYNLNSEEWSEMGGGTDGFVESIEVIGTDLYIGGDFGTVGGIYTGGVAKWDGTSWSDIGAVGFGDVNVVKSNGTDLYVGGWFQNYGGLSGVPRIIKYSPSLSAWSSVGAGLSGPNSRVEDIAFDGDTLYVAGRFDTAVGNPDPIETVAKFDGINWSQVGTGLNEVINSTNFESVQSIEVINGNVFIGGYWGENEPRGSAVLQEDNTWKKFVPGNGYQTALAMLKKGNELIVGGDFWGDTFLPISTGISVYNAEDNQWYKLDEGARNVHGLAYSGDRIAMAGYFEDVNNGLASFRIAIRNTPTVVTEPLPVSSAQGGETVNVAFTVTGSFNDNNTFYAELSDANGNFRDPRILGSVDGEGSGSIDAFIPFNIDGSGFKIRVRPSNYANLGAAQDFTILPGGQPVAYYWIGGSGDWSDLSHWSTTSGGTADHTELPSRLTNVFFDENSFDAEGQEVFVDQQSIEFLSMEWTGVTQKPSFTGFNEINVYGSLVFIDSMVLTVNSLFLRGEEAGNMIKFPQNKDIFRRPNLFFEGPGTFELVDSTYAFNVQINQGTLNTNDHPFYFNNLFGNGADAMLNLGNSTLYGNNFRLNSITLDAGTSTINVAYEQNSSLDARGYPLNNVVTRNTVWIYGSHQFEVLETLPGSSLLLEPFSTTTTNSLVLLGTRSKPINLSSIYFSSQLPIISIPGSGTVSAKHVIINNNTAEGGALFSAEESIIQDNVVGWSSTPWTALDYYWVGNGGSWEDLNHWSSTSGGSPDVAEIPGGVDNVIFDENSFSQPEDTVEFPLDNEPQLAIRIGSIDMTGVTNNPLLLTDYTSRLKVSGNFQLSPNMTADIKSIDFVTLENTSTRTIGGQNYISENISFTEPGDWILADSVHVRDVYINRGNFSTNGQPLYADFIRGESFNNYSLDFSNSNIYVNQSFNLSFEGQQFTPDFSNSQIFIEYQQSNGNYDFHLNGFDFGRIVSRGDYVEFFGSATIDTLELIAGSENYFEEGSTITINGLLATGTDDEPITISSQRNNETFEFAMATGTVDGFFLNLRDNRATTTGDAVFNAFSTLSAGIVEGWIIESGPDGSVSETTLSFNRGLRNGDIGLYSKVTNTGDIALQSAKLRYYISADDKWDPTDLDFGIERDIQNLSSGESNFLNETLPLSDTLTDQEYFIIPVYDPDGEVSEIRDGNNAEPIRITMTDQLPAQELLFSVLEKAGGSSEEVSNDIAGDEDGNSYITGYFSGSATFGDTILTAPFGSTSAFLSKVGPDGNFIWTVQVDSDSTNSTAVGRNVVLDQSGNPIVSGYFTKQAKFYRNSTETETEIASNGNTDGFVARFDKSSGAVLWATSLGGGNPDEAASAAVNGDVVYVTGFARGEADLAGIVRNDVGSQRYFYISQINLLNGSGQNAIIDGLGFRSSGESITVNTNTGDVYVGGYFERETRIGQNTFFANNQSEDAFIARYSSSLSLLGAIYGGERESDRVNELVFDGPSNALFAGGDFFGFICLGSCTESIQRNRDDGFVAKLTPSLTGEWMRSTDVDGTARVRALAVDEEGAVYFAGGISGFLETGTKIISTQGDFDALIGRYFFDGGDDFLDGFGGTGDDAVFGLDVAANKIQMSGSYFGALDIPDVGRLISTGNRDVMLATASTDRIPPTIIQINAPEFYTVGSSEVASIEVTDAFQVKVRYRRFSEPESARTEVDADVPGNLTIWTFNLSILSSDPLGGDYYFDVIDVNGNKVTSELQETWLQYSEGVPLDVPKVGTADEDFRLISFPLNITSNGAAAVFGSNYGNNNDSEDKLYLLYSYSNNEVSPHKNGTIELGSGYWFLTSQSNPGTIISGAGRVPKSKQGNEYTAPIRAGWNLIGNPYDMDINASDFFAANPDLRQQLEYWNGASYTNESVLEPYKGYFVNNEGSSTQVVFPISSASGNRVANNEVARNELSESNWGVVLNVKSGPLQSERTHFGIAPEALDEKDQLDQVMPPNAFTFANLSFAVDGEQPLIKSIVENTSNYKWSAKFESNLEHEIITFEWDNSYWGNNDLTIVLYDKKREKIINMREQTNYQFRNTGEQEFEFIYGTEQFIRENVVPAAIEVSTYPNPFRGETTIEFALPDSDTQYNVTLNIYNSIGQWVTTLVDGVFTKGFYDAKWDGRNASGTELNQGIYIYKLVATDESGSKQKSGRLIIR